MLASGWRRYADRECTRVDVTRLQARLRAIRAEERLTAMIAYPRDGTVRPIDA